MHKNKLSIEEKLLLSCAKTIIDTSATKQLEGLLQASYHMTNWKWLLEHSMYHGVLSLIYYNIDKLNKSNICKAIFPISKNYYYATLERNKKLWEEFLYIQDVFQKLSIKVLPIKGIILNKVLYPDSGLRPMFDIDVLIQEENLMAAKEKILQLNYQKSFKNIPESYWRKYHCHLEFYNPYKNIIFELHWQLAPTRPNKLILKEIWQRSDVQLIDGVKVLTLSLEDTLLSLVLHISKNISTLQYLKLRNLCDINELITRYSQKLDWNYIINKTKTWRLKGALFYIYLMTHNYLDTLWPRKVITELQPKVNKRIILNFFASKLTRLPRFQATLLMSVMLDTTRDCLVLALLRIFMLCQKGKFFLFSILRRDE